MGFETILPFLRPLAPLLDDETVTEILVNGASCVFVERAGLLAPVPGLRLDNRTLVVAVKNIARALGDDVSESKPLLDARLPDGSRVAAVLPPCSVDGVTLAIRKFAYRAFTIEELVRVGTLTVDLASTLRAAILAGENILIAGATGTGKTTLLNALTTFVPDEDRIVLIEETAELKIDKPNLVRLEARRAQSDCPAVTIRDLVRTALRLRPDRIVVGEMRGAEAFDMMQAWSTGHQGSLSTIHAASPAQALDRFTSCVLQADVAMPYPAIRHMIGDVVQWCLHLSRRDGRRRVTDLVRLERYNPSQDAYEMTPNHTGGERS